VLVLHTKQDGIVQIALQTVFIGLRAFPTVHAKQLVVLIQVWQFGIVLRQISMQRVSLAPS
jgi:hypothetical protein